MSLVGPDGLLTGLTKQVLVTALEVEMDDHLGYEHGDRTGKDTGNERHGKPVTMVTTQIGPVEVEVPRDRDGMGCLSR